MRPIMDLPSTASPSMFSSHSKQDSDSKMSLRCSFCLKNQLFASKNPSASANCELLQISPMLSVHKLCLESSSGLKKRANYDYSYEDVAREVSRCKEIPCDFCNKNGATVLCTESTCINSFHLSCFFLRRPPYRGKRQTARSYCQVHLSSSVEVESPPSVKGRRSATSPVKTSPTVSPRYIRAGVTTKSFRQLQREQAASKSKKITAAKIENSPVFQSGRGSRSGFAKCAADACLLGSDELVAKSSLKYCQVCRKQFAHVACVNLRRNWMCGGCTVESKMSHKVTTKRLQDKVVRVNGVRSSQSKVAKEAICSTMKLSFCKDIDTHLDRIKAKRRNDRSPLSLRQKEDRLSSSSQLDDHRTDESSHKTHGKENKTQTRPVRRKPLDTWIVRKDLANDVSSKKPPVKKHAIKVKTKSPSSNQAKRQKLSPERKSGCNVESSPAKKFVENSQLERAPLAVVKKVSSEKTASHSDLRSTTTASTTTKPNVKKLVKRISVEPIPLEQRQLYHIRNTMPITCAEEEAEEDYQWLVDGSNRQVDDFLDLNEGEKAFFKLWNTHLHKNPCYGDRMLTGILHQFVDEVGDIVVGQNLYKNFVVHLISIFDFGIIDQVTVSQLTASMRRKMTKVEKAGDLICDDLKPDTASSQLHMTTISRRLPFASTSSRDSVSSSRCSTPLGDCGSSISSGPSVRLYLSESEDEGEQNDVKTISNTASNKAEVPPQLKMTLRQSGSPPTLSPRGRSSTARNATISPTRRRLYGSSPTSREAGSSPARGHVSTTKVRLQRSEGKEGQQKRAAGDSFCSPGRGSGVVHYACERMVDRIADLPVVESGPTGARFGGFAPAVFYHSRSTKETHPAATGRRLNVRSPQKRKLSPATRGDEANRAHQSPKVMR